VGDVGAGLGITFRRLSYRGLTGAAPREEEAVKREPGAPARGRGRGGRRGRRGGWRDRPAPHPAPAAPSLPPARGRDEHPPAREQHTAPHDEIVGILQDLIGAAGGRVVTIDTLANALKSRGFSRPPGSPRLITRLRRLKELTVSRSGALTLADGDEPPPDRVERPPDPVEDLSVGPGNEAPRGVGEAASTRAGSAEAGQGRRRRDRLLGHAGAAVSRLAGGLVRPSDEALAGVGRRAIDRSAIRRQDQGDLSEAQRLERFFAGLPEDGAVAGRMPIELSRLVIFSSLAALRPRIFARSASLRNEHSPTNPRGSYIPMS